MVEVTRRRAFADRVAGRGGQAVSVRVKNAKARAALSRLLGG